MTQTWPDGTSTLRSARSFQDLIYRGTLNVREYGAQGDGATDDTVAIQTALDDASPNGYTVEIPRSPSAQPYMFSNLLLNHRLNITGPGPTQQIHMQRIAGSTGPALRERSVAEGNPGGASEIYIRNIWIDGNSTTGDGISLGNTVGSAFNFVNYGGIENVYVGNFTSGTGFNISSNVVIFNNLMAYHNLVGMNFTGAGSFYQQLQSFQNIQQQIIIADGGGKYHGVHVESEQGADSIYPLIDITASISSIYGITANLLKNHTVGIRYGTACVGCLYDVFIDSTLGKDCTNVIFCVDGSFGTGGRGVQYFFPEFRVQNSFVGTPQHIYDVRTSKHIILSPVATVFPGTVALAPMTTAARNALTGLTAGATVYDTTLHYLVTWDGSAWRNQAAAIV